MDPIYSYYYQQQFHHRYVTVSQSYTSMQFPLSARHLTPQQWGASLREHQNYYHHRLRQQLIPRYNNPFQNWANDGLSYWQWHRFHTQQAIATVTLTSSRHYQNPWNQPGSYIGPPQWQGIFRNNHDVTAHGAHEDETDNGNHRGTGNALNNSDVKMVDITEIGDGGTVSKLEEKGNIDVSIVEIPYCSDVSDSDEDETKDAPVIDSNDENEADSIWTDYFLDSCQKNYDNLVAISNDWDAIKRKFESLEILSKEIDQKTLKMSLKEKALSS